MSKERCPGCDKKSLQIYSRQRLSSYSLWVHEDGSCGRCNWNGWRHIDYNHLETHGWTPGETTCVCSNERYGPQTLWWRSVRPSHTAALAMAGWYLLLAPAGNPIALPQWRIIGTYNDASDCVEKIAALSQAPKPESGSSQAKRKPHAPGLACLATDDPRLRGGPGAPLRSSELPD
jgi:hypothetical protein